MRKPFAAMHESGNGPEAAEPGRQLYGRYRG
jgi:hypothetical protein